ncbi:MAG: hypothetical protein WAM39_03965 [Bryobacteraceae bacterium]
MYPPRLKLLSFVVFLSAVLLPSTGCHPRGPQSVIRMSDLHTQKQLMSGFYELEAGAWRWTAKAFTVSLKVPNDAASKGAVLILQGTIVPDALANGPLEVSSSVEGTPLTSQSFSKSGEMIYRVDVPATALQRPVVIVKFVLSATHRVPGDLRDLGVISSVISLRSK